MRVTITTMNPYTFSYISDVIRSIFVNINVCQSITLSYFTRLPSGIEFRKYRLMSRQLDCRGLCVDKADRNGASSCGEIPNPFALQVQWSGLQMALRLK
jgi:hypothetical protein